GRRGGGWGGVTGRGSRVCWRSSSASWRNCLLSRRRRSAGVLMRSSRGVLDGWDKGETPPARSAFKLIGRQVINQPQPKGQTENAEKCLTGHGFCAWWAGTAAPPKA